MTVDYTRLGFGKYKLRVQHGALDQIVHERAEARGWVSYPGVWNPHVRTYLFTDPARVLQVAAGAMRGDPCIFSAAREEVARAIVWC